MPPRSFIPTGTDHFERIFDISPADYLLACHRGAERRSGVVEPCSHRLSESVSELVSDAIESI